MPYIINKSNGQTLTTIADRAIDTTSTSLSLIGRSALNYGSAEATNIVHLMENFASGSAPANPLVGQMWYDITSSVMKMWNGTSWISAQRASTGRPGFISIEGQTTPPALPPYVGATYLVPTNATGIWATYGNQLAQWNGTNYDIINPPTGHQVVNQGSASLYDGSHYLERLVSGSWVPGIPLASQSGQWQYAVDTGTATNPQINLNPAPVQFLPGMQINVKMANAAGPITAISINGTNNFPLVRKGNIAIAGGEWKAGDIIPMIFDGNNFVISTYTSQDVVNIYNQNFAITSPIVKTVYGSGADFSDLNAAFAWLSQKKIATTGSVQFNLSAGKWDHSVRQSVSHPDGTRVYIVGAALKAPLGTPQSFTVSGYSSSSQNSDGTANLATLRACYSTELTFSGNVGGIDAIGGGINIQNVLFTGSNLTPPTVFVNGLNVLNINAVDGLALLGGSSTLRSCAVAGFFGRGLVASGGAVATCFDQFCSFNNGFGNICSAANIGFYGNCTILSCGSNAPQQSSVAGVGLGIATGAVSFGNFSGANNICYIAGCSGGAFFASGCSNYAGVTSIFNTNTNSQYPYNAVVACYGASSFSSTNLTINNNAAVGAPAPNVFSLGYSASNVTNLTANGNTGTALFVSNSTSNMYFGAGTINSPTSYAFTASGGAYVNRSNLSSVTGYTTAMSTPALNTAGNGNSYIQ